MSVEGLREAVLKKTRAEAEAIEAKAEQEAHEIVVAGKARAEALAAEIIAKARRDAAEERRRELSAIERRMHLKALDERNRIIEEVLIKAAEEFARLPAEKLGAVYERELSGLDLGGAVLSVPPGQVGVFERLRRRGATLKEDTSVGTGYTLSAPGFRLDGTLKVRLEEIGGEVRAEIARMLFEGTA